MQEVTDSLETLTDAQQRWLAQLYEQMYPSLFVYAQAHLADSHTAEEVVQETFKIACMKIDTLAESPAPNGWLMTTLKHVMRNAQRRQALTAAIFDTSDKFDENRASALTNDVNLEFDIACTQVIGQQDYEMLKQAVLKQATISDIAQEFGLSEQACYKRIQRNKQKLRKIFANSRE
jgi:RNA polymerase sigma-70 factor (ECF subfamily)